MLPPHYGANVPCSPQSIRYVEKFMFFFFNDTAPTEIYTLSLHDALPISAMPRWFGILPRAGIVIRPYPEFREQERDRKSTRLNSSHSQISYAVFCLKKKTRRRGDPQGPRPVPARTLRVRRRRHPMPRALR